TAEAADEHADLACLFVHLRPGTSRRPDSSPTRRSSDLRRAAPPRGYRRSVQVRTSFLPSGFLLFLDRLLQGDEHHVEPDGEGHQDRKSTRLNSSHVKISYAVFCWKKKATPQPRGARHGG